MKQTLDLIMPATIETLIMVSIATFASVIFGMLIAIILIVTRSGGIHENKIIYFIVSKVVDGIRSMPFLILMILLIPLSRVVVGTGIGTTGSIIPLTVAAAPFFARLAENSLLEVKSGVIEAALSMGATNFQVVKLMIGEVKSSLIRAISNLIINLIGYSAVVGAIGGGGLGDVAIRYGFHRNNMEVTLIVVIILYILVSIIQYLGNTIAKTIERGEK